MSKNQYGVQCFFRLPQHLVGEFDKLCQTLGYTSRAEFFTAIVTIILDGEAEEKDSLAFKTAAEFISGSETGVHLSPAQISRRLRAIIDKMLKPVIAIRGVETACSTCLEEVREAFHEKYGIWLTEDEIREGFYQYDLLNKPKLRDYALSIKHQKEGDNI